jgi:iron complex outermembrane receptor protein
MMFQKILWSLVFLCLTQNLFAQTTIMGTLKNEDGETLIGANVQILDSYLGTITDAKGQFSLEVKSGKQYVLRISFISYQSLEIAIDANKELLDVGELRLERQSLMMDEFTVEGTRVGLEDPMAYTNMDKEAIEKNNLGQDLPYLLDQTPSVVVTSDAGAGIGYTGIRIRGSDPTRINVTINGVPLNDSESQGVFWVNMPDFATSVDNIQIQRGLGASSNGGSAFGATINLQTNTLQTKPYAILSNSIGSFNSRRHNLQIGSGLIKDHWTFEGRLSQITSDGYIDRASSKLRSYYLSGAYINEKTLIRANLFSGHEITYQAWGGLPVTYIDTNRTWNPYTYENEVDNYRQTHAQLHWNQEITKNFTSNFSLHYTKGAGFFEQYREGEDLADYGINPLDSNLTTTDLIRRRWLDNDFYGFVFGLHYQQNRYKMTLGGGLNRYYGDHFGEVIWARNAGDSEIRQQYYQNDAVKWDGNVYYKLNYQLTNTLGLYADIQYRYVSYDFLGFNNELENVEQSAELHFFNPKLGATFIPSSKHRFYGSVAMGNREPNRNDFTESTPNSRPSPETLYDLELGYEYKRSNIYAAANAYFMYYQNQLVLNGQINDVGAFTRTNVAQSYRGGLELMFGWEPIKGLHWNANATFSQNKILEFTEYVDNWDTWGQEAITHNNTDIAFSPNIIAFSELDYDIINKGFGADGKGNNIILNVAWISKFVGKQYIDNTMNDTRALDPYWVNDLRISYQLKNWGLQEIGLNFMLRNFLNEQFVSNAWVYRFNSPSYDPRPDDPYTNLDQGTYYNMIGLYPQAGINFMLGLDLKF